MSKILLRAKLNESSANPGSIIRFYPGDFWAYDKLDLDSIEAVDQWINVKYQLPLYKQRILFFTAEKDCVLGCYNGLNENEEPHYRSDGDNIYLDREVTHWMNEPELPND